MNALTNESGRLYYLDAARAFALILGIVFHAGLSFMPIFIGWAVMDVSTSHAVSIFALISHSFRLELFFLIAGFFSHMTFHKDGIAGFLKSRIVRIGIPFIIGWTLLRPLLVSGWVIGAESMRGETNILNGLIAGFASLADLPKDLLVGTHLWFLYYLLIITAIFIAIRSLVSTHSPIYQFFTKTCDRLASSVSGSWFGILMLSAPTALCLWYMNNWGMDTPDKSLKPHFPVLLIYSGFFLFGWLLQRQKIALEKFTRLTWGKLAFCLVAIGASIILSAFQMQHGHPQYWLIKSSFMLSYAVMMWTLVSLTLGVFKRLFDRPSQKIRYLADSSYWLYLIHLPIVIWLQIAFAELSIHWSAKWLIITSLTVLVCIVLYDILVRSTFIGRVLNGKRKPRVLFAKRKDDLTKVLSASN